MTPFLRSLQKELRDARKQRATAPTGAFGEDGAGVPEARARGAAPTPESNEDASPEPDVSSRAEAHGSPRTEGRASTSHEASPRLQASLQHAPDRAERLAAVEEKSPALAELLGRLDPAQLAAVLAEDRAALVRAQVGSGKTTVLVYKVLYLHLVRGVPLREIAVLTFTTKAAAEIRARLTALRPDHETIPSDTWLMGTFHGVAHALLSRVLPIDTLGYRRPFSVLDEDEREAMLDALVEEHGLRAGRRASLVRRIAELRGFRAPPERAAPKLDLRGNRTTRTTSVPFVASSRPEGPSSSEAPSPPKPEAPTSGARTRETWSSRSTRVSPELRKLAALVRTRKRASDAIARGLDARTSHTATEDAPTPPVAGERGDGAEVRGSVAASPDPARAQLALSFDAPAPHAGDRPTDTTSSAAASELARLAEIYRARKITENVMDFDDLVEHATSLLGAARASGTWAAPRWILIDEAQDADVRERAFVERLRGPDTRLFAVGDPLQSIYGWRGSSPDGLASLCAEPEGRGYGLPASYRSTRTILEAARAVLGVQPVSTGALVPVRDDGPRVIVRRHHDPIAEAVHLADRIEQLVADGTSARDIGVLTRLNAQHEPILRVFADRSVPVATADDPDAHGVRLLTLHGAKGLELRHVFISGVNHGLLPLAHGATSEAEERRLLFVGMTRAKDTLELGHHACPAEPQATGFPSPFLDALPEALIDRRDGPDPRPAKPIVVPSTIEPRGASEPVREPEAPIAAPAVAPSPSAPPDGGRWSPGQKVRHPKYGVGTIVAVQNGSIDCDFGKLGARSFRLELCPLTPIAPPSGA